MQNRRPIALGIVLTLILTGLARPAVVLAEGPGPRIVTAWPSGPLEVRVAFDAPVEPGLASSIVGREISFGGVDPSGSQKETDPTAPTHALRIAGARLEDDGRTLVLATDPHPLATTYTLPDALTLGARTAAERRQYDLHGIEVAWFEGDEPIDEETKATWNGWWPVLGPRDAREATAGSIEQERGFTRMENGSGALALRTLVSQVEEATSLTLQFESDRPFEATLGFEPAMSAPGPGGSHRLEVTTETFPGEPAELTIRVSTGGGPEPLPDLVARRVQGDQTTTIGRDSLRLPWAPLATPTSAVVPTPPFDLSGGDPAKGREVFLSETARCGSCHKIEGQGGDVGPALDTLAGVDLARIYRDIADPSAAIDPEYLTYTVALEDGRVAVGVVRAEGADALRVLDTDAKVTVVPRAEVADLLPSGTSVMPVGLAGALGEQSMRDLVAYLRATKPTSEADPDDEMR